MNRKISKPNENLAFFNARLDEVRMSGHERLRAKARLAQAEAVADAIVGLIGLGKRLLKAPFARPTRRPTTSTG
jgi:hypothetical protein